MVPLCLLFWKHQLGFSSINSGVRRSFCEKSTNTQVTTWLHKPEELDRICSLLQRTIWVKKATLHHRVNLCRNYIQMRTCSKFECVLAAVSLSSQFPTFVAILGRMRLKASGSWVTLPSLCRQDPTLLKVNSDGSAASAMISTLVFGVLW